MRLAGGWRGAVVVDCAALQSPTSRGRGIGRYALEWATALEAVAPELVGAYLLDPSLPPPGEADELLASGKVAYRGADRLPDRARVWHSLSPLDLAVDLETIWPGEAARRDLRRSATVYDLIPAKDPATHLADPVDRRRYRIRLEALRGADQLHVISAGVGADVQAALGVPASRIVVAGAAPSERYWMRPAGEAGDEGEAAALGEVGVRGRFVLYPTGSHPRKNNEGLLAAWALLPEALRREVQLVLTGEMPASMAHHLCHLAEQGGFRDGVVVAGLVGEETLLALYRAAELVCFPSLAEGYGLPVAEALACGTPVIGADRAPLDELLASPARFDPEDPAAIAEALEAALDGGDRRHAVVAANARPAHWDAVARRSAAGLEALVGWEGRSRRRRRLAFVSPFPPAQSGVARYSARLVEALAGLGDLEIDCFVDGPTPDQRAPEAAAGSYPAGRFAEVARLRGGYDEVVFTLGNSHHHLGALEALRRRRGIVLAHDVRLTNLYLHERSQPGAPPGGLAGALGELYGTGIPGGLGALGDLQPVELEQFGLLMAREAIASSRLFLVTSEAAVGLARTDARPEDAAKIRRVPFAFAGLAGDGPDATAWAGPPVVAHFGIVDPSKQPFLVLEAFTAVAARFPGARLSFVGPVSEPLAEELRRRAEALGIGAALTVAGAVEADAYAAALGEASVAVQLRATTNGEASAAIGDCLASGIPTIVTELGWARELPDDAVVRVDRHIPVDALGALLVDLLDDEMRRARLAKAGREEAYRRSFEAAARALVELAGLGGALDDRTA